LLGLLGFYLQQQGPIIEKILGFMSKIVHKAISDMQEVGMTSELKAMWCALTDGHDDKNHLEQVSNLICYHPSCQYFTFVIKRSLVEFPYIIET
jgi:hypothetical protein